MNNIFNAQEEVARGRQHSNGLGLGDGMSCYRVWDGQGEVTLK